MAASWRAISPTARPRLRSVPLVARSAAALVMCQASEALCLERYGTRAASGRATAHFDHSVIDAWGKETTFDDGAPALGIPILEVDTSHGYRPPLPDLLAPCYALFGHP